MLSHTYIHIHSCMSGYVHMYIHMLHAYICMHGCSIIMFGNDIYVPVLKVYDPRRNSRA